MAFPIRIGSHVSIAGGVSTVPRKVVEEVGGNAFQVFVHNPRGWRMAHLDAGEAKQFRAQMQARGIPLQNGLVHSGYLVNLASGKEQQREKSIHMLAKEATRCHALGLGFLNFHPGSVGEDSPKEGFERIGRGISEVFHRMDSDSVMLVLENISPKGGNVGSTPEEIARMIRAVEPRFQQRVGFCLDTCHAFDRGYNLVRAQGNQQLSQEIKKFLGWDRLQWIHLNDSKFPRGEAKDRHALLGEGTWGKEGLEQFLSFRPWLDVPLVLETPGDNEDHAREIELVRTILRKTYPDATWDWRK
ncbi:MAG TPA: deoxyribonuclease IV [Thermotogota bacterium]|nr:deoxyribonuclease IV [Thermotogota bacterium]HRW92016.1 deoxyribonuclease IV [Thermotogota bacterium]